MNTIATTPEMRISWGDGRWLCDQRLVICFCLEEIEKIWHLPANPARCSFWLEASSSRTTQSQRVFLCKNDDMVRLYGRPSRYLDLAGSTARICCKLLGYGHTDHPFFVRLLYQENDLDNHQR